MPIPPEPIPPRPEALRFPPPNGHVAPNYIGAIQSADLLAWLRAERPTIESTRPTLKATAEKYNRQRPDGPSFKDITVGNLRGMVKALGMTWPTSHAAKAARRRALAERNLAVLATDFCRFVRLAQAGRIDEFGFSRSFAETFPCAPTLGAVDHDAPLFSSRIS